jgi:hypothetical protein
MTIRFEAARCRFWRLCLLLSIFLIVPRSAYSQQLMLTGAMQFSTNSTGAFYGGNFFNTVGGDNAWDLWLALKPDASLPVNGPADAQAGISIRLEADHTYKYYIFASPNPALPFSFNGLNLFFNGNTSAPGISVFGQLNSSSFVPNGSSTLALEDSPVAGSGTTFYNSGAVVAVLTGYDFNSPATPPGDVCQPLSFTPGGGPDLYGSFTLHVFPAATLSLSESTGSPGASVTVVGSGFAAGETVVIYASQLGSSPIGSAVTDATGSFTATVREPQYPYGPNAFFGLGRSSGELGASSFFVEPSLAAIPASGEPGSTVALEGAGFGAGETVSVYWNNPRTLVGTAVANGEGSFVGGTALNITIPVSAPSGLNIIVGIGQTTNAFGVGEIEVP